MVQKKVKNLSIQFVKKPEGINSEVFARILFEKKGYKVTKKNGSPKGIPDFLCEKEKKHLYVEVKGENDSLRISQLRWIKQNPDEPILIFVTEGGGKKYRCIECGKRFIWTDITLNDRETFCYSCLIKKLFISFYEQRNGPLATRYKEIINELGGERVFEILDIINKEKSNYENLMDSPNY